MYISALGFLSSFSYVFCLNLTILIDAEIALLLVMVVIIRLLYTLRKYLVNWTAMENG